MTAPSQRPIIVALSLSDDQDEHILSLAKGLAHRLALPLRLVHALELFRYRHWLSRLIQEVPVEDLEDRFTDEAERQAAATLQEVARRLGREGLLVTCRVAKAQAAVQAVHAEAEAAGGCLIIVGPRSRQVRDLGTMVGLGSTTRGLMSHSTLPVLVLPEDADLDFSREGLRLLLADDLSEGCDAALTTAFALANRAQGARLSHVHVLARASDPFNEGLSRFVELTTHIVNHQVRQNELLKAETEARRGLMERRAERHLAGLGAARGRYEAILASGAVRDRLEDVVRGIRPDLVVTGRHQSLHTHPLMLGQVPHETLIQLGAPVMVVPTGSLRLAQVLLP